MAGVIYVGQYPEVELPLPDGEPILAKQGEVIDVPAAIANDLAEQENWEKPSSRKQKSSKKES